MTASRILVVDDEADIRGLLKEILAEEGYEVEVAADATQARSSRAAQLPDLVLLDIWMPDTDGITLLREWSVTDGYDCPVVMMSGHGTVETAVEATRLGAFDFVEKPLSLTKLLRTVERALDAGRRKRLSERAQGSALALPIGKSKLTQNLRELVQQAATSSSSVLFIGELGSGREAYARHLHSLSARSSKPFHMVVAASLGPDPAMALFGSEREGKVVQGALSRPPAGPVPQRARRSAEPGAARLDRRHRAEQLHPRRRPRAPAAQRALGELGAGGIREPRLARAVPSRSHRASERGHVRVPPLREYAEDVPNLLRYSSTAWSTIARAFAPFQRGHANRLRNCAWPGNLGELQEPGPATSCWARARKCRSRRSSAAQRMTTGAR